MPKILLQLEEWKKRLIDLSRKNQLIYCEPTKKTILELQQPDVSIIFKNIMSDKAFDVWLPYEEVGEDDLEQKGELFDLEIKDELPNPRDIVFKLNSKKEIERRLKSIYRRALSDYQEKGIRTAVVTIGLLCWKENEEEIRSPLLLYPIEIAPSTPNEPYRIFASDEDIILNPALQVKLNGDFKVQLPEGDFDADSFDLYNYFSEIERLGGRDGWKVENRSFIGIFTFHKIAMYRDLDVNAPLMENHHILKGLAEGYYSERLIDNPLPDEKDLDNEKSPEKMLYIMDADSSQSKAIEVAVRGHSYVLKGPPGTGKSQTICNIIAEFLESGKTVLFVSEKMAALEVVFNRLREANLTDFCLELHSHKANKKEVVNELVRCLELNPHLNQKISKSEFEYLRNLRQKLNEYILELHKKREPLGESMFVIFGKLAELERFPLLILKCVETDAFKPSSLETAKDLIARLKDNYVVMEEGDSFPWRGFKLQRFSPGLKDNLFNQFSQIRTAILFMRNINKDYASRLGLEEPQSLAGSLWFLQICKLLKDNPRPCLSWWGKDYNILITEAEKQRNLNFEYFSQRSNILQEFSEKFLDFSENDECNLRKSWICIGELLKISPDSFREFIIRRKDSAVLLENTKTFIQSCCSDIKEINNILELKNMENINLLRAEQIIEIGDLFFSTQRPEKSWLDPVSLNKVKEIAKKLVTIIQQYQTIIQDLNEKYDSGILKLEVPRLIFDFEKTYKSFLKYLIPRYYRDLKAIRMISKDGVIPLSIVDDLKEVRDVIALKERLVENEKEFSDCLQTYYAGFDTNIEAINQAHEVANKIIYLIGELPLSDKVKASICTSGIPKPELRFVLDRLKRQINDWKRIVEGDLGNLLMKNLPKFNYTLYETPLVEVENYINTFSEALLKFNVEYDKLEATFINKENHFNLESILQKFELLKKIKFYNDYLNQNTIYFKEIFAEKYNGLDTNWDDIIKSLHWVKDFIELSKEALLPKEFLENIASGVSLLQEDIDEFEKQWVLTNELISKLSNNFNNNSNYFTIMELNGLSFEEIDIFINGLNVRIDDLQKWFDYADTVEQLKKLGYEDFIRGLVSLKSPKDTLWPIFKKAFYYAWTTKICDEVGVLGEFRGSNHNNLIQEFRQLDKELNRLSSSIIIEKLNSLKPSLIGIEGGVVSKLRNEYAKKTRRWTLRKLFSEISEILLKLKPCLLMSPLSLSHYLNMGNYCFDLVIFDEASQICSEDAIGSIARGRQLIVAGDDKQLPPTKFFQGDSSDDVDEDENTETFDIYQSILDDCERIGLTPQPLMLKWHYRSKHEALIAYSNSKFYKNRLVTFPCAKDVDDELGVKFRYVPDGIFDRGGKRNNLKEAEVVANLVIEHFLKYGASKTLGVATLNLPQKDLVMDVLEIKKREFPELAQLFQDDRLNGFFVKNLESVQGDERDVIILSLGYGKDSLGRFTMNFGPINKEGGERRLNVIVTRAKEKIVLVSSIKSADFKLESINTEGVRHLYHYLDYAERGKDALMLGDIQEEETESPFEEDVKNEIKSLGYNVISQVGCSCYRIDLGIIDPARPGCFILGIECDGRTYHSAFTARERDRIRQEVLAALGWRIYRIWSPDWFFRRKQEIERLRAAIDEAKNSTICAYTNKEESKLEIIYAQNREEELGIGTEGIREYQYYKCQKVYPSYEFNLSESAAKRAIVLQDIVELESPIHVDLAKRRLMNVWGFSRLGPVIEDTIERTIRNCVKQNNIFRKGGFLWDQNSFSVSYIRVPNEYIEETVRDPEYVCIEEIQFAISLMVKKALCIEKEALYSEIAKLFGWNRMVERVEKVIQKAFSKLVDDSKLSVEGNKVTFKK